jgi:hypothetical protein
MLVLYSYTVNIKCCCFTTESSCSTSIHTSGYLDFLIKIDPKIYVCLVLHLWYKELSMHIFRLCGNPLNSLGEAPFSDTVVVTAAV